MLQWGRPSSGRKTMIPEVLLASGMGFNGAALHQGGRLRWKPGNRVQRMGFNGAALHQGGRQWAASSFPEVKRASMGPPFIRAEDSGPPIPYRSGQHASMGPPFIRAEDRNAVVFQAWRDALQWGRPSSGRKTASGRVAARRLQRFNGAALHQGGRPAMEPVDSTPDGRFNGAALHQGGRPTRREFRAG